MSRYTPIVPLWEGEPPNHKQSELEEKSVLNGVLRIENVQTPTIEVRLPAVQSATGQGVVICPGGGYRILAYDWEGLDVASWLNSKGIAAFVLKYRLPEAESNVEPRLSPLMDAQRALRLVRSRAAEWGVDPSKLGIMGFSAGGHLASTAGTSFDAGNPEAEDLVERFSSRPDFMILMYPVITFGDISAHTGSRQNLLGENPSAELIARYSNELRVTKDTPPTFLVHSGDDSAVPVRNSLLFYEALVAHGVPAEMHIFPYGGHGYGLAVGRGRLSAWPDLCAKWLQELD